jgi:hypothetical protein
VNDHPLQQLQDRHVNCSFCEDKAVAALIDTDDGNSVGVCRNHFDRQLAMEQHFGIVEFNPLGESTGEVTDEQIAEAVVALQVEGHSGLASIVGKYVTNGKTVYRVVYVDGYERWLGSAYVVADNPAQAEAIATMRRLRPQQTLNAVVAGPFERARLKDEYVNKFLTTTDDVKAALSDG